MDNNLYVVVQWPKCQELMGIEGWLENSYLINDSKGISQFGSSAYFVKKSWLDNITQSNYDIQN